MAGISSKASGSLGNRFKYNGKELQSSEFSDGSGLGFYDYGARMYDYTAPHWIQQDLLADKFENISPYVYANNNPASNIDIGGKYAVSVHYDITYTEAIKIGCSKERADLIAHYASTYSDHPTQKVLDWDNRLHIGDKSFISYRKDIDYSKTAESQDEKNSKWHAMMSDKEAADGMTEDQAMLRGLQYGWDNIFAAAAAGIGGKENLEKLGPGLHALQDAIAHRGVRTSDHLGWNTSSAGKLFNDAYGFTSEAAGITRSALIVEGVLAGQNNKLNDGEVLNLSGMSGKQMGQFLQALLKQGFTGTIHNSTN